jgi:UrcA family protein
MNRTRQVICAMLAAGTLVATPIQARETTISATVEHRDLDLTTASGAAELERRARIAILQLCGTYDRRDGVGERPFRRCRHSARLNPTVEAIVKQARLDATTLVAIR